MSIEHILRDAHTTSQIFRVLFSHGLEGWEVQVVRNLNGPEYEFFVGTIPGMWKFKACMRVDAEFSRLAILAACLVREAAELPLPDEIICEAMAIVAERDPMRSRLGIYKVIRGKWVPV